VHLTAIVAAAYPTDHGVQHELPKLYSELESWWPLLSSPADYAEEAGIYHKMLVEACDFPPQTLLELGSGGGNSFAYRLQHARIRDSAHG
jgi:hypothetical protein